MILPAANSQHFVFLFQIFGICSTFLVHDCFRLHFEETHSLQLLSHGIFGRFCCQLNWLHDFPSLNGRHLADVDTCHFMRLLSKLFGIVKLPRNQVHATISKTLVDANLSNVLNCILASESLQHGIREQVKFVGEYDLIHFGARNQMGQYFL